MRISIGSSNFEEAINFRTFRDVNIRITNECIFIFMTGLGTVFTRVSYSFLYHLSNLGKEMDMFVFSERVRPDCVYICNEFDIMRFPLLDCNMVLISDNICCLFYGSDQYFIKLNTLMNLVVSKLDEPYERVHFYSTARTIREYKHIQFFELTDMSKITRVNRITPSEYNEDYAVFNECVGDNVKIHSSIGNELIRDNQSSTVILNPHGRFYISFNSLRRYDVYSSYKLPEEYCYEHIMKVVDFRDNKWGKVSLVRKLSNFIFKDKIISKYGFTSLPLHVAWISHNTFLYISEMDQCLINVDTPQKVGSEKTSYSCVNIAHLEVNCNLSSHFYRLMNTSIQRFYSKSSIMNLCNWINRRNIILPYISVEKSEAIKKVNYWRHLPVNVMSVIARFAS
jgi:hypothetical protein